jgi:hypothetical protein
MTSPTDIPATPPAALPADTPNGQQAAQEDHAEATMTLRRTLRSATGESWDVVGAEHERVGVVTLHYGADTVEGVLALPPGVQPEAVRGMLGWVTDLLVLDQAAGPGGMIHWVVSVGEIEDFWRRSPGHRATGAQLDVATAKARVEAVLANMFGQVQNHPDGGYAVDAGSVRVFVAVRPVDEIVLVRVFSITNVDVPVDGDLPAFLLGLNFSMAIGRFSIDTGSRAVWFDHVLGADELDDGTLSRTVAAVAQTADKYDDEVKARFGGRTFREEGSPVAQAATGPGMAGGYL